MLNIVFESAVRPKTTLTHPYFATLTMEHGYTAIEVSKPKFVPRRRTIAHPGVKCRREIAEDLGLFCLDSVLVECPTCGADVPDHALDLHVSFHPVCQKCKSSFISDFALEIHQVVKFVHTATNYELKRDKSLAPLPTA